MDGVRVTAILQIKDRHGHYPAVLPVKCLSLTKDSTLSIYGIYELAEKTNPVTKEHKTMIRLIALHEIRADIPAGTIGGWIEKAENLSGYGSSVPWVGDNAMVFDDASIRDGAILWNNAVVCGSANVHRNANIGGDARIYGNAQIGGAAVIAGSSQVYGDAVVTDWAVVEGCARVYGDAQILGNSVVCGASEIDSARVIGHSAIVGTAMIKGKRCGNVPRNKYVPDGIMYVAPGRKPKWERPKHIF